LHFKLVLKTSQCKSNVWVNPNDF